MTASTVRSSWQESPALPEELVKERREKSPGLSCRVRIALEMSLSTNGSSVFRRVEDNSRNTWYSSDNDESEYKCSGKSGMREPPQHDYRYNLRTRFLENLPAESANEIERLNFPAASAKKMNWLVYRCQEH